MKNESVSPNTHPSISYTKRPRHKTRSDKYEYRGEVSSTKVTRKQKRTRRGCVGNEMFQANNVDAERVTLRPRPAQSIYSRTKMSLPLAGHDTPDLTFTMMNFLSRPAAKITRDPTGDIGKQRNRGSEGKSTARTKQIHQPKTPTKSEVRYQGTSLREGSRNGKSDMNTFDDTARWILDTVDSANSNMLEMSRLQARRGPPSNAEKHRDAIMTPETDTSVPWSTSPPRSRSRPTIAVNSHNTVPSAPLIQAAQQITPQHVLSGSDEEATDADAHFSFKLTQNLLRRGYSGDFIPPQWSGPKRYVSLEELNDMLNVAFGEARKSREPSHDVNDIKYGLDAEDENRNPSASLSLRAVGNSHRQPSYIDYDRAEQQFRPSPTSQQTMQGTLSESVARERTERECHAHRALSSDSEHNSLAIRSERERKQWAHTSQLKREEVLIRDQGLEHRRSEDELTKVSIGADLYEESIFDDNAVCATADGISLDVFDRELLETTNRPEDWPLLPTSSPSARTSQHQVTDHDKQGQYDTWRLAGPMIQRSDSLRDDYYRSLFDRVAELRGRSSGFDLHKPSLQRLNCDQDFNPFADRPQFML